ncbi:MAG: hypothetical protein ABI574_04995 [Burkholderiales bacterium]
MTCLIIADVKQIRLFILVLMTVLLPIRGAVAAAMACPQDQMPQAAAEVTQHAHHAMQADPGMHGHDAASPHVADAATPSDDTPCGGHAGTCQFCASGCCVTPLASTPPSVATPLLIHSVTFPALCAAVPAFQSEGQERPPRTL